MKRFRGTDVGLGVLAIVVNVALVVALVVWVGGRNDEPNLPTASKPTPTASKSASPSATPSPSPSTGPAAVLARTSPVTIAVLGDQTSDGKGEWVSIFAELLGRNREVTVHQLDPQDPTIYADEQTYGTSGPEVAIYNGSRGEANADYAAKRLAFLSPKKPDLVVLNYGRNDTAEQVTGRLASTTTAARKTWKGALVVTTLQPPTNDDASKGVRDAVVAWAKASGVGTIDVAKAFIDTGEPNAYVSSRDRSAMTTRGDQLWGRTAYRLLVGTDPPEVETTPVPEVTPTPETTEPVIQPSTSTPRRTTSRPRTTTPPETTTTEPEPTPTESPSFTRRPPTTPPPVDPGDAETPPPAGDTETTPAG